MNTIKIWCEIHYGNIIYCIHIDLDLPQPPLEIVAGSAAGCES